MKKAGLVLFKYGDLWVVPGQGRAPDGYTIHTEPVTLVQHEDAPGLGRAIRLGLSHHVPVPEPAPGPDRRSVMAKALNLKSERVFHDGARAFYIHQTPEELSVQEWKKAPRLAFSSPALWKRTFGPDDVDELVWFLVKHDAVAFLQSSGPA